jgi:hypothetical protein
LSKKLRKKIQDAIRNAHLFGQTYSVPKGEWRRTIRRGKRAMH